MDSPKDSRDRQREMEQQLSAQLKLFNKFQEKYQRELVSHVQASNDLKKLRVDVEKENAILRDKLANVITKMTPIEGGGGGEAAPGPASNKKMGKIKKLFSTLDTKLGISRQIGLKLPTIVMALVGIIGGGAIAGGVVGGGGGGEATTTAPPTNVTTPPAARSGIEALSARMLMDQTNWMYWIFWIYWIYWQ